MIFLLIYTGPLSQRQRKTYFRVTQEIKDEIIKYYLDESNTIICSGMKECVKIKVPGQPSISLQKQILIYDIKDLYKKWVNECGHEEVPCLHFFTKLRPKQCVIAGDPGTHNVCVCPIHQNVKLKLAAVDRKIHYTNVIEVSVCSVDSKECMLQDCKQCVGKRGTHQYLESFIDNNRTNVEYSNWVNDPSSANSSFKRVTLKEFNKPVEEFLADLTTDIWNMIPHHFISSEQKQYFNFCKEHLTIDTGLLIMDFAENYSYLCQNSTQGFYFSNSQATLFTAALYYRDEASNELKITSFCVISNSTIHQAYSVHIFMENVLNQVKQMFPWINNLIEYSDGAPTQFKNK